MIATRTAAPGSHRLLLCMLAGTVVFSGRALAQTGLDFEFYRDNVEPIFIQSRGDFTPPDPGEPACVLCHTWQTSTPMMLESLEVDDEGEVYWTEAQSRTNFAAVSQLVSAGDPQNSRLLLSSLSEQAGGTALHTGGKVWESQDDPEWQILAEWVETGSPSAAVAAPEVDYEFFRACMHPILYQVTPAGITCANCHVLEFAQADPQASWNAIERLIEPGQPTQSRLLMHPLHPDGGGDYAHNGVRRWMTQDDAEWQMLAEWINGERAGADCEP
ncbi:MAG: hypothetical protein ACJ0SL_03320 [Candidatus Rariloculaceae bacterium]